MRELREFRVRHEEFIRSVSARLSSHLRLFHYRRLWAVVDLESAKEWTPDQVGPATLRLQSARGRSMLH